MPDMINTAPGVDFRKPMSGKDGAVYDRNGVLMANVESFQTQVAITNQTYQPLGTAMERSTMSSYRVTLTFTEVVVNDPEFFRLILDGMRSGIMPVFNFRGMMRSPYDGSEEQIVYRDCVPDGTIDIQNMTVGELYKRNWTFVVNNPPEALSHLYNL